MCRRTARLVARLSAIALPGRALRNIVPRICCIDPYPPANGAPSVRPRRVQPPSAAPTDHIICIPPKKVGMRRPVPD